MESALTREGNKTCGFALKKKTPTSSPHLVQRPPMPVCDGVHVQPRTHNDRQNNAHRSIPENVLKLPILTLSATHTRTRAHTCAHTRAHTDPQDWRPLEIHAHNAHSKA